VLNLAAALFCQDGQDPTAKLPPYCAPRGPASGVMSGVARTQVIDKRLVLEHVGKDVSGFGIMRLDCELRQRDTLKQFNESEKDLVCKRALRKKGCLAG
jgi:hypothetical protein